MQETWKALNILIYCGKKPTNAYKNSSVLLPSPNSLMRGHGLFIVSYVLKGAAIFAARQKIYLRHSDSYLTNLLRVSQSKI